VASAALLMLALMPTRATAQELAGVVKRLFDQMTINAPVTNPTTGATVDHRSHFFIGGEQLESVTRDLNAAIAEQLALFPLPSSSGGFSFSVNDRGEVLPTSSNFGPLFAERAVTIGRGQLNFGFTFQRTAYDAFEGVDLESGALTILSAHNNCCPATNNSPLQETDGLPLFERDLLRRTLTAEISTNTTAFFANYGVTDRFDLGVAVPIVRVAVDARVDGEILRTPGATDHVFDNNLPTKSVASSDSATGLGDILLRTKYSLFRNATTALAVALDLRLPTGDKDNLLGSGATQAQPFFVVSGEYGRISPHANIGYTFSNGDLSDDVADVDDTAVFGAAPAIDTHPIADLSVPDRFDYTFGVSVAAHPRLTLGFDVRGRTLRDVRRFALTNVPYANSGPSPGPYISADEFEVVDRGNLNSVLGVAGGKVNLGGTFLLNLTVIFSMTDEGLKPKPTPVIGFDYVF
jgi:hypothetical protein